MALPRLLPCHALALIQQRSCLQVDVETRDPELAALCSTARWQTMGSHPRAMLDIPVSGCNTNGLDCWVSQPKEPLWG